MIYGYLHQGSGIGNQLHRMIAARIKADELGVDWRLIWNPDNSGKQIGFKASSFINFDNRKIQYGMPVGAKEWNEKKIVENGIDIRSYDPEFNFIEDNTIIEGEFQDERYWEHKEKEVNDWLMVAPLASLKDLCVIGFRGGEYSVFPELFLSKDYWNKGIEFMKKLNPDMRFEVHTDDMQLAKQFFPDYSILHNAEFNWRSMRFAKYAIIANSSFYIFPRWLNKGITIAPRFWARHNTGQWALAQNYYKRFLYV